MNRLNDFEDYQEDGAIDGGGQTFPPRMISYAAGTTGKHECGDPLGQVKDGVETS